MLFNCDSRRFGTFSKDDLWMPPWKLSSKDSVVSINIEVKSTDSGARMPSSNPGFAICSSVTFRNCIPQGRPGGLVR